MIRDQFGLNTVVGIIRCDEAAAGRLVSALLKAGMVTVNENRQYEPSQLGKRLAATPLIKRFPASEGRAILEKVVEVAQCVNASDDHAAITGIRIFGSALIAADEDLIGDIDLVVSTALPRWSEAELMRRVGPRMPKSVLNSPWPFHRKGYPEVEARRLVKNVSRKVSVHSMIDIHLFGCEYSQIYAFDPATEHHEVDLQMTHRAFGSPDDPPIELTQYFTPRTSKGN